MYDLGVPADCKTLPSTGCGSEVTTTLTLEVSLLVVVPEQVCVGSWSGVLSCEVFFPLATLMDSIHTKALE